MIIPYMHEGELINLVPQSHIAASARDVAMIQRQAVEIEKWKASAEKSAKILRLWG